MCTRNAPRDPTKLQRGTVIREKEHYRNQEQCLGQALFSTALSRAAYVVSQIQGHFDKKAKMKSIIITSGKQSRNCISRQPVCFRDFPLCGQKPAHLYSLSGAWEAGDKTLTPVLCKGKGQAFKDLSR